MDDADVVRGRDGIDELAGDGERGRGVQMAALVDLSRAQDRRKAALELAADEKVSLEQWPAACRAFPPHCLGCVCLATPLSP